MADKCNICREEFSFFVWKYQCSECRTINCYNCFERMPKLKYLCSNPFSFLKTERSFFPIFEEVEWLCKICWRDKVKPIVSHYEEALQNYIMIELVSDNYRGNKSKIDKDAILLESQWFRDRNEAEKSLKVTAKFLDRNLVNRVTYSKETRSKGTEGEGTYYYTVWKAEGRACRFQKNE